MTTNTFDRTRKKFMINGSSGVVEAETVIKLCGGTVVNQSIDLNGVKTRCKGMLNFQDALIFLILLYDYVIINKQ